MNYRLAATAAPFLAAALLACVAAPLAQAQEATTLSVALKDHRFMPAELTAPANKPVVIVVTNQDTTPSEFESKTLRVEKVVAGGAQDQRADPRFGCGPLSLLRRLSRGHDRRLPRRPIILSPEAARKFV